MAQAVTRLGDMDTGHAGFPPRPSTSASPNVFVNGLGVHRVGDTWGSHCDPNSCHTGTLAAGSPTVFANGLAIGRVGDPVSCGGTVDTGSGNVFSG